ncbi:thrombospondin [Penaeus vannamei]|uniref:Thrombospondin n=1 Tax=Penaeus vannamei TaxID=6689 RepID=A0A3R7QCY9_PENVA|nr:thrombospondin [Penaeus vannamei]
MGKCNDLHRLECPGEGRFPDLNACGQFYDCTSDSNGSYVMTRDYCRGFVYNATARTCSGDVRCKSRRSRSPPIASHKHSHLCEFKPDSFQCADCKNLVMCIKGQAFIRRCTSGAFCDKRERFGGAVCYPGRPQECTCEKPHSLRQDLYDPQRFFSCESAGSKPEGYRCQDNMIFDEALGLCRNKESTLSCTEAGLFAIPKSCSDYFSCIPLRHGWVQRFYMCTNNRYFSQKSEACKDPCSGNFVCTIPGYFGDPFDTRRFFVCFDDPLRIIKIHYQCPTGHVWNSNFTRGAEQCVPDTEGRSQAPCFVPIDSCPDVYMFEETGRSMLSTGACDQEPCFPGVSCNPAVEAPFYSCDPCPPGAEGDGVLCKCGVGFAGDGRECHLDSDLDGFPDRDLDCPDPHCRRDNCIAVPNSGQEDTDGDAVGDACDDDADGDGLGTFEDNCPLVSNPLQEDADFDARGDRCDNCPYVPNPEQKDTDGDFVGDDCDDDIDNDGILNEMDNCPFTPNAHQVDTDGDGVGDVCDNCPEDANPWQENKDENAAGDACDFDIDSDRDGVQDSADNCPVHANSDQVDVDGDGAGDACDKDSDNDGKDSSFADGRYRGDACRRDFDGDGVEDASDNCIRNPTVHKTDFRSLQTVSLDHDHYIFPPEWVVNDNGTEIHQTKSTDPVLAVGPHNLGNVDYEGTLYVTDHSDDDYVGIVFSYQTNAKFYAMTWKKETQFWSALAEKGVQLRAIDSATGPGRELRRALWDSGTTDGQVTVLWQNGTLGWHPHVAYRWQLHHRPDLGVMRLFLYEGRSLVADSGNVYDDTLKGGRLGLYCFSQRAVVWSNLRYACADDLPKAMLDDLPPEKRSQKATSLRTRTRLRPLPPLSPRLPPRTPRTHASPPRGPHAFPREPHAFPRPREPHAFPAEPHAFPRGPATPTPRLSRGTPRTPRLSPRTPRTHAFPADPANPRPRPTPFPADPRTPRLSRGPHAFPRSPRGPTRETREPHASDPANPTPFPADPADPTPPPSTPLGGKITDDETDDRLPTTRLLVGWTTDVLAPLCLDY